MNELREGQVKDGIPVSVMVEWEDKDAVRKDLSPYITNSVYIIIFMQIIFKQVTFD